jgi:hypothetical protein
MSSGSERSTIIRGIAFRYGCVFSIGQEQVAGWLGGGVKWAESIPAAARHRLPHFLSNDLRDEGQPCVRYSAERYYELPGYWSSCR